MGVVCDTKQQIERFAALDGNEAAITTINADAHKNVCVKAQVQYTASTNGEIDAAFASLAPKQIDALVIAPDTLFSNRRSQLATLATHHRVPASYWTREYPEVGGLMSYGASVTDRDRQAVIKA
jgi:hypothetical protein